MFDYILLLFRRFISLFFKIPALEKKLLNRKGFLYPYRSYISPKTFKNKTPNYKRKSFNGVLFDVDISQVMGWKIYYELEADILTQVLSHLNPNMTVIDVGANVGYYSVNLGLFLTEGYVHAFEPDPDSYKKLSSNIHLNNLTNVVINNKGLGHHSGEYALNDPDKNNMGARFVTEVSKSAPTLNLVSIITLDNYVQEQTIDSIGFIKIDVEGFEIECLKGARKTIALFRPILFIEVSDPNLRRSGTSSNLLLTYLKDLNYTNYLNLQEGELISFDLDHSGCQFDILCLP